MDFSDMTSLHQTDVKTLFTEHFFCHLDRLNKHTAPYIMESQGIGRPDISRHSHPVPEIFMQVTGNSLLKSNCQEFLLEPGDALIIAPDIKHIERKNPDSLNLICKIMGKQLLMSVSTYCKQSTNRGQNRYDWLYIDPCQSINGNLMDAIELSKRGREQTMVIGLIESAFRLTLHLLQTSMKSIVNEPDILRSCRMQVMLGLKNPNLSVATIASECGCHPDHLGRLVREYWGTALQKWIIQMRMNQALQQLDGTPKRINEVALDSGYSDPQYFSRAFKKAYGLTPSEYRRRHCSSKMNSGKISL